MRGDTCEPGDPRNLMNGLEAELLAVRFAGSHAVRSWCEAVESAAVRFDWENHLGKKQLARWTVKMETRK